MTNEYVEMEIYPAAYHADTYSEIVLVSETSALPIYVSYSQAESIINGLHGKRFSRPFTHDLFIQSINALGACIKKVVIDDLMDGVYMAHIYIEQEFQGNSQEYILDARPSDCIALAVREGCSIFVANKVLEEAGRRKEDLGLENF